MHLHHIEAGQSSVASQSVLEKIVTCSQGEARALPPLLAEAVRQFVTTGQPCFLSEVVEWVEELLGWSTNWQTKASMIADQVIEAMLLIGEFGAGIRFGQPMILQSPLRVISVPNVGGVSVGGAWSASDQPAFSGSLLRQASPLDQGFPLSDVGALPDLTEVGMTQMSEFLMKARAGIAFDELEIDWQRRLVVFTCALDPLSMTWRMDVGILTSLMDWLGLFSEAGEGGNIIDPDQELIIGLGVAAKVVVEAGPGSGKTHIACRRIVRLIEDGAPASRIWLLSFTRVAVEEIRQRIASSLTDPSAARAITVATFDTFAARILHAELLSDAARPHDYEPAVKMATSFLVEPSTALQDFFANLSHVVIDEAQDLLGLRLEMVRLFLKNLPDSCGVTILGDPAQAIYKWSTTSNNDGLGLMEGLQGYGSHALKVDHRTQDPTLAAFFEGTRGVLLGETVMGFDRYLEVRERIEAVAQGRVRGVMDPMVPVGNNGMVLFRGRRALLAESDRLMRENRSFRIRTTAHGPLVQPWIGALLARFSLQVEITREEFSQGIDHATLVLNGISRDAQHLRFQDTNIDDDLDEAWHYLRSLVNAQSRRLNLSDLHTRLLGSLPPSFLRPHLGDGGPLLGTIHSAKGLEADTVVLMMPRTQGANYLEDEAVQATTSQRSTDWDEEARILYVGATRAKRILLTGIQRAGKMNETEKRIWRGHPDSFSVEIGMKGDVEVAGSNAVIDLRAIDLAAHSLAAVGPTPRARAGIALRLEQTRCYAIYRADAFGAKGGPILGYLSDKLLEQIARLAQCEPDALPDCIDGFFISGAATSCWSIEDERGIGLIPVLCGFANITKEISDER